MTLKKSREFYYPLRSAVIGNTYGKLDIYEIILNFIVYIDRKYVSVWRSSKQCYVYGIYGGGGGFNMHGTVVTFCESPL